jgi:hypothetical protein
MNYRRHNQGGEFRNWVLKEFGVQIGFLEMVEPGCTVAVFAQKIITMVVNQTN